MGKLAALGACRLFALGLLQWMLHPAEAGFADLKLAIPHGIDPKVADSILTPYQLGVQHIDLFGTVPINGTSKAITLLTFLKVSLASNGSWIWTGRANVYDPSRVTLDQDQWPLHATPRDVVAALPNLSFSLRAASQSRITSEQVDFQMDMKDERFPWDTNGLPYAIHMTMDRRQHNATEYYFCIGDWPYTALVSESLLALPPHHEPGSVPLAIYSILNPIFGITPERAALLIGLYTRYNVEIGFNASILYERGGYLQHYTQDHETAELMYTGQLKVLLWDHSLSKVPLLTSNNLPGQRSYVRFDQLVVYNHAIVAFHGLNAWLFMADHDEWLVLQPSQQPLAALITSESGCLLRHRTVFQLPRYHNFHCKEATVPAMHACIGSRDPDEHSANTKALTFADDTRSFLIHTVQATFNTLGIAVQWVEPECAYIAHLNLEKLQKPDHIQKPVEHPMQRPEQHSQEARQQESDRAGEHAQHTGQHAHEEGHKVQFPLSKLQQAVEEVEGDLGGYTGGPGALNGPPQGARQDFDEELEGDNVPGQSKRKSHRFRSNRHFA